MKKKDLRVLFLYPNLHMSTLVPNAVSILTAVLKRDGFESIELFDTTFYESDEESKDENRVRMGQVQPFTFDEKGHHCAKRARIRGILILVPWLIFIPRTRC